MLQNPLIISLSMPLRMGSVNCYLLQTDGGFILIDTGGTNARQALRGALEGAGCSPGALQWVLITHGDFDHIGNAAFLRAVFGARIAMHTYDAGMAERGDMFVNRKRPNLLIRALIPLFTAFRTADHFSPDVLLTDGYDLSPHGLDARVLSIPGHSKGSIGILTAAGDLFSGDLIDNTQGPMLSPIMDDLPTAQASLARLQSLPIKTVYPGHGQPFTMDQFG